MTYVYLIGVIFIGSFVIGEVCRVLHISTWMSYVLSGIFGGMCGLAWDYIYYWIKGGIK